MPTIDEIVQQIPGIFMWKDKRSVFMGGNVFSAKLAGVKDQDALVGLTDATAPCPASEYADIFVAQDRCVIETQQSHTTLDIYQYADTQVKSIIGTKSPLYENGEITGVICHGVEVSSGILAKVGIQLAKNCSRENTSIANSIGSYDIQEGYSDLPLSQRESEILFFMLRGKVNKEIAYILHLSKRTVEHYIENMKNKMTCNSRSQLIEMGIEGGYMHTIPKRLLMEGRLGEMLA